MATAADESGSIRPSPSRPLAQRAVAYPRQRAIRACQLCRARRIKCDDAKPACSSCKKVGAECITAEGGGSVLDAGSLQILQRIDHLEELLKKRLPSQTTTITASTLPTTERHRQLCVTTEEVLSWTVFQGHYDSHRDLKALLLTGSSVPSIASPMSIDFPFIAGDVEHASPQRMLDNFFRSIHVKNPMLDESKIKQEVRLL